MTELFCPLYRGAQAPRDWKASNDANTGLFFDKFGDVWNRNAQGVLEFDKGIQHDKSDSGKWLKNIAKRSCRVELLRDACQRQGDLARAMSGRVLRFTNTSRFVTGLGREHPTDNGFAWHHTLGTPYLPGSSLKGALRAWLRECEGELEIKSNGREKWIETERARRWFGEQEHAGHLILLDLLPVSPPKLVVDAMTPHYGPYYQGGETPGDWHNPNPISFLVVEEGTSWQCAILPAGGKRSVSDQEISELTEVITEAFEWLGIGAKTAVGYGRFDRDKSAEDKLARDVQQREQERLDKIAVEEKFRGLSPELATLVRQSDNEKWIADKNSNSAFLEGIDRYLTENPNPSDACIDWIRDHCLELFWKGIWNNPDAVRGKQRRPKFKKRPRELVHRLKSVNNS